MDSNAYFIKKFCSNPKIRKHKDIEIAQMLTKFKAFEKYRDVSMHDSLRRKVSHVRKIYNLRDVTDMSNFDIDMENMINKYPDATQPSLATKLRLKYPNLTVSTIKYYLNNFKNYGIKQNTK